MTDDHDPNRQYDPADYSDKDGNAAKLLMGLAVEEDKESGDHSKKRKSTDRLEAPNKARREGEAGDQKFDRGDDAEQDKVAGASSGGSVQQDGDRQV